MIEGLYGAVGVMYCNVFLIPTRVMAFAAGESVFAPDVKKSRKEVVLSIVKNKVIIAIVLALVISFSGLPFPAPVLTALKNLGRCMSPFSLVLVGSMLTQKIKWEKGALRHVAVIAINRLLCIPLAALVLCWCLRLDMQTAAIITLLLGMPAGSTVAIFARKYGGDTMFASAVVFVTTVLSTFSLVGLMKLIETVY